MEEFLNGKKIVHVPNEYMLNLERTWYEYEGLKTLLLQFTSDSPFKPDTERFDAILTKYLEAFMEYNMTFNLIVANFLTKEDAIKNITANFQLSAMMID